MYVDIKKFTRMAGYIVAMVVLAFGIVTFAFSITTQDQIAGTLAAMFGLQLLWFTLWLARTGNQSRPSKPRRANDNWL